MIIMFSNEAVNRLLQSVDPALELSDSQRIALRDDLNWGGTWYRVNQGLRRSKPKRQKSLEQVLKAVSRLNQLLTDEVLTDLTFSAAMSNPKEILKELRVACEASLQEPVNEPDWATRIATQVADELALRRRSPFEWFVGEYLPKVFEEYFGRQPTLSRNAEGMPEGKFIRFTDTVLTELGIDNRGKSYSLEAVAKALTDARRRRSSRAK